MAVSVDGGLRPVALAMLLIVTACNEDGVTPVIVTAVEVTSPIGSLVDVGGTAQLSASATTGEGQTVSGASFAWSSTHPNVASIDAVGFMRALDVGTATLVANVNGVSGRLPVRVVSADRAGITLLATDPFVVTMIGATTGDVRTRLQSAGSDCISGADQGRLESVQDCVTAIDAEASAVTDPTDRALLAVLVLFFEEIERLLGL